jgi:hypothetical protein
MVGAAANASPSFTSQITNFASDSNQLVMQRLTMNSSLANLSNPVTRPSAPLPMSVAALQACMSEDDMSFTLLTSNPNTQTTTAGTQTANADTLPSGGFNNGLTKREFAGQYTWLATLVPVLGDLQPAEARNLMTMSVVVFNKRQFGIAPQSATPQTERACQVTAVLGSGYGGGDLILSGSSSTAVGLRVGECLMLGWMQRDVPGDSNNNATVFGPDVTFPASLTRPMFRWYRILNAGPPVPPGSPGNSGSTWIRYVTVSGTDLNRPIIVPNSMWAFVYDGAVAVYERTVRLEGPSMWTN